MTLQELLHEASDIQRNHGTIGIDLEHRGKIIDLCKRFAREEVERIEKAYEYDAEYGDMQDAHKTEREIQAIIKQLQ